MMQKKKTNPFLKYSGIGLQMITSMAILAWLGSKADEWFSNEQPFLTLIGLLFGVIASIVSLVRSLNKDND
ncbi:MAG: AtpZ/AtpI family protein [Cytophagales bacterium]